MDTSKGAQSSALHASHFPLPAHRFFDFFFEELDFFTEVRLREVALAMV